jgi:energy-coupling factor transporter ATP-binding protein EcfA2
MKYKDIIKLNFEYNKSINILFNKKIDYIETASAKKALKALNYHNALALIGPFGSGKSAFLLYLDNLIENKEFLKEYEVVKIVADNRTFLENLQDSLNLKENLNYILNKIKNRKILFLIDEFGKFLENDALDIQSFVEFLNKDKNLKVVVALHKSFSEYKKDFSKIQGRFENIIFRDDINENVKILKKAIIHTNEVKSKNYILKISKNNDYLDLAPLHPFSVIAIIEIFNKFFQNQRSVFSFLFSNEKGGFSEFLNNENAKLYTLSELYDYLNYLLEVYDIALIDKESFYIANKRLQLNLKQIEKDIIKAVAVVDIFKINLNLDEENLIKTFIDRYSKKEIEEVINKLKTDNFLTFLMNKNSFSLVEDLNIDLNKEIEYKKSVIKIKDDDINKFISKKFIAKEFFIEYGNRIEFERVYKKNENYKIILSDKVYENEKSVVVKVNFDETFFEILKELQALNEIREENNFTISNKSKEIIDEMIEDKQEYLDELLENIIINSSIFYENIKYKYSYKTLQNILTKIAKKFIYKAPKINNYTLIHTTSKQTNTSHIKKLFQAMLENSDKENLGIEKYPPHKALYLSVIKASGIHKENKLNYPNKLNFNYIFEFFDNELQEYKNVDEIVEKLKKEPFCLKETISLFL